METQSRQNLVNNYQTNQKYNLFYQYFGGKGKKITYFYCLEVKGKIYEALCFFIHVLCFYFKTLKRLLDSNISQASRPTDRMQVN